MMMLRGLLVVAAVVLGVPRWPELSECSRHAIASTEASTPPRIAIVLRGESFRNVGGQHMRGTCCELSVRHQRLIYRSHLAFFEVLRREGYAVDAFSATRPCTSTNASNSVSNATETLKKWYGPVLRGAVEDPLDRDPFSQLRNRHSAVKLARDHARDFGVRYAYVFVMRWDYVFHAAEWRAGCVLDDHLHDARGLLPHEADADKLLVVPARFVKCFFASIVEQNVELVDDPRGANFSKVLRRPPRCHWDGCVERLDAAAGHGHVHTAADVCPGRWLTKLASVRKKDLSALAPEERDDPERDAAAIDQCVREDFLFKDHWKRCSETQRNRDGCSETLR